MSKEKQRMDTSAEAWQEVGQQFKLLGESLSVALRSAWESEATQQSLRELQTGIHSAVEAVNNMGVHPSHPPSHPQPLTNEVARFLQVVRRFVTQVGEEDRQGLITVLEGIVAELQDLIAVLKKPPKADVE